MNLAQAVKERSNLLVAPLLSLKKKTGISKTKCKEYVINYLFQSMLCKVCRWYHHSSCEWTQLKTQAQFITTLHHRRLVPCEQTIWEYIPLKLYSFWLQVKKWQRCIMYASKPTMQQKKEGMACQLKKGNCEKIVLQSEWNRKGTGWTVGYELHIH